MNRKLHTLLLQVLQERGCQTQTLKEKLLRATRPLSFLIHEGYITSKELIESIAHMLRQGKITPEDIEALPNDYVAQILQYYAKLLNLEFIDLDTVDIDPSLSATVPFYKLQRHKILPLYADTTSITLAMSDPIDIEAKETAQNLFPKKNLQYALVAPQQLTNYLYKLELNTSIREYIQQIRHHLTQIGEAKENDTSSNALIQLIQTIFHACITAKASDIHIEPTKTNCLVRARIDGILTEKFILDHDIYPPLASRIKLMANLDIAERRKPQDGRFSYKIENKEFDFRISTLPTIHGESLVLRILDTNNAIIPLEKIGMSTHNLRIFTQTLQKPHGMILVTGPTGSGKTTTLYGALNRLRSIEKKIITIEDPIEYQMNLIQQCQVNPKIGFTFSTALRSVLRQDPDIIMIGEIRDQETLRIAMQSAMTGHLVLTTLHTNNAIGAISRIIDMGIEPYFVSNALIAIEAQRLIRTICPHCKVATELSPFILEKIASYLPQDYQFFKGKGCKHCDFTGYHGRDMICEILPIDETLRHMISQSKDTKQLYSYALSQGFIPMLVDGVYKALDGVTTIDEVLRVTGL